jgi:hypothetical protein
MKNWKKTIGILAVAGIALGTAISTLNQISALYRGRQINLDLEKEIGKLENEKSRLSYEIKVATTSAYQMSVIREQLGVGSTNDYWIVMPEHVNLESLYPKYTEINDKPIILKWIEVFTH